VTGAAVGMDFATAQAFAEAGAALALADVNRDAVQRTTDQLVQAGNIAIAVHCNVPEAKDVAIMVEKTVAAFGRLDAAFPERGRPIPRRRDRDVSVEDATG
jgi:NAD(P)-dependent dehydrogenase (short-subunit alcohol dehydrogenase family)